MKKIRSMFYILITAILILGCIGPVRAYAQEETEDAVNEEAVTKETQIREMAGPIIYLTPRAKPEVIYIGNDAENTDYSFIIDKDTTVEHMKDLKSLKVGDTVKIKYAEVAENKKMGGRKVVVEKRVAKVISFVRAGVKKRAPGSASEPKTNVFVSD